jgi:Glycosyl hydrolases family 2, sugar binding domain/Glycosyl hydrolases family 2, TIM barrel domain
MAAAAERRSASMDVGGVVTDALIPMESDRRQPPGFAEAIGHPRPLLRREAWWSLDGQWDFATDVDQRWSRPEDVEWSSAITVPFAPETEMSGVGHWQYLPACWYRRTVTAPPARRGERLLLHFGAVDYAATVWIDGRLTTRHEGGYTPFFVDVTHELGDEQPHELVVLAEDDPLDLAKPRGKQDWELLPHAIWYPRTTGIWQTVWLERVSAVHIAQIQWRTDMSRLEVECQVRLTGRVEPGLKLRICLRSEQRLLVDDIIGIGHNGNFATRAFRLDASGLDHLRESLLWTPDHPAVVDALLELCDGDARPLDRVHSYTAIREVSVDRGKFLLNGRPYQLRLVLDQGYWENSGLTPPSDDALRADVEMVKAMGFNGVRKHQKIEDARFLHWADRLGLLVWVEMPPAYQFDAVAIRRTTDEWLQVLERDRSHPCIVAWVPFNESTGVLNLPRRRDEQHWVRGLAELTKALDPSRPVISNDGWETIGGDIIGVHDYDQDPESLLTRWSGDLREVITNYAAHGRAQTLDESPDDWEGGRPSRAIVLTEVGGIGWSPLAPVDRHDVTDDVPQDRLSQPAAWGYSNVASAEEFESRYAALMSALHRIPGIAGFCYTQLSDTYQEINGLLTADRVPKIPLERIAEATRERAKPFIDPMQQY